MARKGSNIFQAIETAVVYTGTYLMSFNRSTVAVILSIRQSTSASIVNRPMPNRSEEMAISFAAPSEYTVKIQYTQLAPWEY